MEPVQLLKREADKTTLEKLGKAMKVSAPYLSAVLNGKKPPGPKVLAYLGLEKRPVSYRRRRNGQG